MSWITGLEVMDKFGVSAIRLGQACHDGQLAAYLPDVELPVYDLSKLPRIPKYPPAGVDQMDHIQIGETVRWDWEEIIGVSGLRHELAQIKHVLGILIPVMDKKRTHNRTVLADVGEYCTAVKDVYLNPYANVEFLNNKSFEELTTFKDALVKKKLSIEQEIRIKTEAPLSVRLDEKVSRILFELNIHEWNESNDFIWKKIMPFHHQLIINGSTLDYEELEGQLVYFNYDMFSRYAKKLDESPNRASITLLYKKGLAALCFDANAVDMVGFGSMEPDAKTSANGYSSLNSIEKELPKLICSKSFATPVDDEAPEQQVQRTRDQNIEGQIAIGRWRNAKNPDGGRSYSDEYIARILKDNGGGVAVIGALMKEGALPTSKQACTDIGKRLLGQKKRKK